jgi:AcrR family transcriptional regulator
LAWYNAAMAAATLPRRTQAERRAATRGRLLEATVECLAERGYPGTTTIEVARRAGLSRGAQLHHFGTKAELVTAAIEHLHGRLLDEFRMAMASLPAGADALAASIDVLWALYSSPLTVAWMELSLAARTDEEVRTRMAAADRRFLQRAGAAFAEIFPQGAAHPGYSIAPLFAFALLDGLALRRLVVRDDDEVDAVLAALKAVAQLTASQVAPAPEEGT